MLVIHYLSVVEGHHLKEEQLFYCNQSQNNHKQLVWIWMYHKQHTLDSVDWELTLG